MIRHFYKSLALVAALTLSSVSFASADMISLCAGTKGRNYDHVMRTIAAELQVQGHSVTIRNLKGSEAILNALNAGECSYGPAQKDVHYSLSKKNAALSAAVTPISLLYNEAMTMFCTPDSGIDELDEVTADTKVIVDSFGSGSAMSWETMVNVEKEFGSGTDWMNASVQYTPLDEAVAALALGDADCVYGIGAVPSNWAEAAEQAGNTMVWIYDKDLNDLMVGKSSLYTSVRIPYGAYNTKFDTYAIPAVLFRSNKTPKNDDIEAVVKRLAPAVGKKYNTVK